METQMFCFQCQETAKGTGCVHGGVCGKSPGLAARMDLLLFITRGVSVVSTALREKNISIPEEVNTFVADALFTTITNANFNEPLIALKIQHGFGWRRRLIETARKRYIFVPPVDEVTWDGPADDFPAKAQRIGVLRHSNEDVRSLKELITYGLKGMAAYVEHARNLGKSQESLDAFIQRALSDITTKALSTNELIALVLETGDHGLQAMALLDLANTERYGNPESTVVNLGVGQRPGILVTGHDLHDLEMLLKQSINSGVDIYTHGEMLPAHYYPLLKKYPHLRGNYGGSWWHQREEFASFNGPILVTSNCIVPIPEKATYRKRVFTTNSAGYPGCPHINADSNGNKDFGMIIEMAQKCQPPQAIECGTLIGGFGHHQMSKLSAQLLTALRRGDIKKIVVMGGCDGRMPSRKYYTEFAQKLPKDCIILTAGCAKYRYNKLNLGDINGIPRVLDAGQCNDTYSLIKTAMMLQDDVWANDLNDLPIVYNIAWYEQKAVIVLLAMLSLGIRNIHLGPTLPAFLSPNVLKVLEDKFGLDTISNVEDDLDNFLNINNEITLKNYEL